MTGQWNRSSRKSGGYRPQRLLVPNIKLTAADIELLRQEAEIGRAFGPEGVKRFWQAIEQREAALKSEESR